MDVKDLGKDLTEAAKKAAEKFMENAEEDTYKIREAVQDSLQDIFADLASGVPIEKIVENYDTSTKALAAAALFGMSEQQSEALSATYDLLENLLWIVIRKALLSISA